MNARFILGTLASAVVAASMVLAGAVIWIATAEPELLATGHVSWALPGMVLDAVARALSLVL